MLYPIADAYVDDANPDVNYGADPVTGDIVGNDRYYLKFNFTTTGITTNLPSLRYYLKLFVDSRSYYGTIAYVYATTNDWDEGNITYNNMPGLNGSEIAYYGVPTAGNWLIIDLTSFIISNCMTKTCSFAIKVNNQVAKFRTKEYNDSAYWPHILIQYHALTTITQSFTITTTETVTETITETETETITTTETFTIYETHTTTTIVTQPITVTETQTTYIPETTVTETVIVGNTTVTAWTEVTQTFTEFTTLTRTVTTTIPVYETVTEAVYQTMTETLAAREAETQAINQILALFTMLIPIIIILVVLKGIMGVAR